jgi:hypothetical protein
MVRAMTNTVDNLLPRPKFDCDGGYDMAVIGLNVVVEARWDSAKCKPGNRKAAKTEAKSTGYSVVWRQLLRTIIVFSFFGQNVYLLEKKKHVFFCTIAYTCFLITCLT